VATTWRTQSFGPSNVSGSTEVEVATIAGMWLPAQSTVTVKVTRTGSTPVSVSCYVNGDLVSGITAATDAVFEVAEFPLQPYESVVVKAKNGPASFSGTLELVQQAYLADSLLQVRADHANWIAAATTTYYVAPNANPFAGDGSELDPFGSLFVAVSNCTGGEVIRMAAGTYNETMSSDVPASNIHVVGAGVDVTIVNYPTPEGEGAESALFQLCSRFSCHDMTINANTLCKNSTTNGDVFPVYWMFDNVKFRPLSFSLGRDAVYFGQGGGYLLDCDLGSNWDVIALFEAFEGFQRCMWVVNSVLDSHTWNEGNPLPPPDGVGEVIASPVACDGDSRIFVLGGVLRGISNRATHDRRVVEVERGGTEVTSGGEIFLQGVKIEGSATEGAEDLDLCHNEAVEGRAETGHIYVKGCIYDASKVAGTVEEWDGIDPALWNDIVPVGGTGPSLSLAADTAIEASLSIELSQSASVAVEPAGSLALEAFP
jgi:archaellum component FlaF (FlaF/FlaG flagellin family)